MDLEKKLGNRIIRSKNENTKNSSYTNFTEDYIGNYSFDQVYCEEYIGLLQPIHRSTTKNTLVTTVFTESEVYDCMFAQS